MFNRSEFKRNRLDSSYAIKLRYILPVIYGALILLFAACSGSAYTSNLFPGPPVWVFNSSSDIVSSPVVENNTVYLRTTKGLYLINLLNGTEMDFFDSPGDFAAVRPPLICGDTLLIPEENSRLTAISLLQHKVKWSVCSAERCSMDSFPIAIETMACSKSTVIVTRYNFAVTGYDLSQGNVIWEQNIPGRYFTDLLIYENQVLYSTEKTIVAANLGVGTVNWEMKINDLIGRMLIYKNLLIVIEGAQNTTRVVAYDLDTKYRVWDVPVPSDQVTVRTYLALDEDMLYVANNYLWAISTRGGHIIWKSRRFTFLEAPFPTDNSIFARDKSTVYGFSKVNGGVIGSMTVNNSAPRVEEAELNPSGYRDLILIPVDNKTLAAYRR